MVGCSVRKADTPSHIYFRLLSVNYTMPIEINLAAIMFMDIAGYTALSAKDETKLIVEEWKVGLYILKTIFNGFCALYCSCIYKRRN